MENEEEIEEEVYTLKETSRLLRVPKATLKRWERVGKLTIRRDPETNTRFYTKEDIETLDNIIES
jgi:DNA-binding transcriptional MerR regulator